MKTLKFLILMVVTMGLLIQAGILCAAETAAAVPAAASGSTFLEATVFPVLGAFLMGITSIFLNRLGTKYKIESLTKKNNLVEQLAFQGIGYAKEQAAKYAKSRGALTGTDKLSLAVGYVTKAMPAVSPEEADRIVHAVLAKVFGEGATGEDILSQPGTVQGAALLATPADTPAEQPAIPS